MNGRGLGGRFADGNAWASIGGRARAEQLPPERRREIARSGWRGLVARRFGGDRTAAAAWLGKLGAWAGDQVYRDEPAIYKPDVYRHPGPCPNAPQL